MQNKRHARLLMNQSQNYSTKMKEMLKDCKENNRSIQLSLNIYQDLLFSKLGLAKKLKGYDLVVKSLMRNIDNRKKKGSMINLKISKLIAEELNANFNLKVHNALLLFRMIKLKIYQITKKEKQSSGSRNSQFGVKSIKSHIRSRFANQQFDKPRGGTSHDNRNKEYISPKRETRMSLDFTVLNNIIGQCSDFETVNRPSTTNSYHQNKSNKFRSTHRTIKRENPQPNLSKGLSFNEDLRPQTVSSKRQVKFAFGEEKSKISPILLSNEMESENEDLKFIRMYYENCFNPNKYLDKSTEQDKLSVMSKTKNMLFLLGKERDEGFTNKYQINLGKTKNFVLK